VDREGDGGVVHVIDEYVEPARTVEEHLEVIEARPYGKPMRIACDPAGNAKNEQTGEANVQLLRRRGYRVHTRGSKIQDGLELIRAALKSGTGVTRLFIHARCRKLIEAMEKYHYEPGGGSEVPVKDGADHAIDALRYFFVNREKFQTRGGRAY
jgi:Terminase RNaseH-like domain